MPDTARSTRKDSSRAMPSGRTRCARSTGTATAEHDLIAADTDGRVWFFRNTTNNLFPVFAAGERMMAAGKPIRRIPNANALGYAKTEITDWNNDGKTDLLVLDSSGLVALHLNEGTRTNPKLGPGVDLKGGDVPVQMPQFEGGLCVCDWNTDGKKDLIGSDADFFQFYENTGTDSQPVLAAVKRITFGPTDDGKTDYWLRPSAGSFLDWDGDGKKDLIAGEFETSIKLYKNIGSGQPGTVPEFADPTGAFLIRPPVGMMIMGADAKDFNGDGDIDILTGQGHGGSGLRFFDRNSIDDTLNNTAPVVTVGKCEGGCDTDLPHTPPEKRGASSGPPRVVSRAAGHRRSGRRAAEAPGDRANRLPKALKDAGAAGTFDEHTVECDSLRRGGQPRCL